MHGIGNDYVYFDCFEEEIPNPEETAIRLSDRRFSIGGDGIILVCKSKIADAKMRMFNADGSEGKMCGNGIRCVAKFLYDVKGIRKSPLTVETLSGIKTISVTEENGRFARAAVDMGRAELSPAKIPARFSGEAVIGAPLEVNGSEYRVTCVSMGNPHCVTFMPDPYAIDLERLGPKFENHEVFPERVNTEFVRIIGEREILMRVWERGSGRERFERLLQKRGRDSRAFARRRSHRDLYRRNGYYDGSRNPCFYGRSGNIDKRKTHEIAF